MARILIIEDTTELARVIARELESQGYEVSVTCDGLAGLERFQTWAPELVILDWMLPKLDGLEVLRRLRQSSMTPVLMLTARGDETDRVVGLEVGADDYLAKPFHMRELVARVHAQLRRVDHIRQLLAEDGAISQQVLHWQGLSLDPLAYQVTLDGQDIELTRLEFELLHLLLRNLGRTFSRVYLLETVWNQAYLEGDRAVDNTVLRLRRKLGRLGEALETVRGVGYRLRINA